MRSRSGTPFDAASSRVAARYGPRQAASARTATLPSAPSLTPPMWMIEVARIGVAPFSRMPSMKSAMFFA